MSKKRITTFAIDSQGKAHEVNEWQPSLFPVDPTQGEQEAVKREGLAVFSQQLEQAYNEHEATKRVRKAVNQASRQWKK